MESKRSEPPGRRISLALLALLFIVAGCLHFLYAPRYAEVVPAWLPHHLAIAYVSGLFEILGGVGVLLPVVRRMAGAGLIALLIAVYPANIDMALRSFHASALSLPTLLLFARLPLQFAMIYWVYRAACAPGIPQEPEGSVSQ